MHAREAILILLLAIAAGCSLPGEHTEEFGSDGHAEEPDNNAGISPRDAKGRPEPAGQNQEWLAGKDMLVMFHNNMGPMCLSQLDFLEEMREKCPSLQVQEMLTTNPGIASILGKYMSMFNESFGVSSSFKFLPVTFINNHAYSGYNTEVSKRLENDIMEVCR